MPRRTDRLLREETGAVGRPFIMIVGIGELLWDVYPDGRKVAGGAPFNFAFHCHQLGHEVIVVSRVGDDAPGRELRDEVRRLGLSDEHIQTDREHPTGTVTVTLDANKVPSYTIIENVAWDYIEWNDGLAALANNADAACFGTLAQRHCVSGTTIKRLVGLLGDSKPRVLDVNLRQNFYTPAVLRSGLSNANWVKLNEGELTEVARFSGGECQNEFQALTSICFHGGQWPHVIQRGILSKGNHGVTIVEWTPEWDGSIGGNRYNEDWVEEPAVPAKVVDTVGAGDAFTAAMVCLHLEGRPLRECARFANAYSARVCEHQGATPRIDRAEVERAL
jgi:fructokinase